MAAPFTFNPSSQSVHGVNDEVSAAHEQDRDTNPQQKNRHCYLHLLPLELPRRITAAATRSSESHRELLPRCTRRAASRDGGGVFAEIPCNPERAFTRARNSHV